MACRNKCEICAELLLQANANVNARNTHGETPIYFAAIYGNIKLARTLLDAGAEPTICDQNGCFPLEWAGYFGHLDVAKELVQRNPNELITERALNKRSSYSHPNLGGIQEFLQKTLDELKQGKK